MPMNRASFPADLEPGLNTHFGLSYNSYPEEWPRYMETETSNRAWEEDVLEYGFGPAVVKAEGGQVTFDEGGQSWKARYDHETIALGFSITQEAIEDNLYSRQGPKYARELAVSMMHTREIKAASVLNNAVASSGYNGGDGVPLLSTAHPTALAGNQSNKLATPADFGESSLEDILIMIRKAKNDRGIPKALRPMELILPIDLQFEAARILGSDLRSGTADNDVNAMKKLGFLQKPPIIVTRLTDQDMWFVKTDCPDGLKHIRRVSMQRGMQEDFKTGNAEYKARERYSNGWSDWRGTYGSEGAA